MSNQIKKSYFLELFNKGMKVEEMATTISEKTGVETNVNDVRKIAKAFNINLKTKPRGNKFQLVNDVEDTVPNDVQAELGEVPNTEFLGEGVFNMNKGVVIE